jgi:RNA polymerase sigma-70 factor (ECF subfamily)
MAETNRQTPASAAVFLTTHWTRVLSARGDSPEAKAALSELCGAYYAPVFAFIKFAVRDEEEARDLTQEFFARQLSRQGLDTVEQGRGKFRSFLLGAVKHFLADMRDRAGAAKRGSGMVSEPLTVGTDTSPGLDLPDAKVPGPEREFDRKWALTVLDRALTALAGEFVADGKTELFQTLKPWLTGDTENLSQAEAANRLGMTEGAVKVTVHRMRRRFRDLVKAEIANTVPEAKQIVDEMRYLIEVLG